MMLARANARKQRLLDKISTNTMRRDIPAVHKATLFSLMNSNPAGDLSKDRLKRVRARTRTQTDSVVTSNELGIYDDVAVYVKDPGQPGRFSLGRIQWMRNKNKCTVEYTNPISLANQERYPKLQLLVSMYENASDTVGDVFSYNASDTNEFSCTSVIQSVRLSPVIDKPNDLRLDQHDCDSLKSFLEAHKAVGRGKRRRHVQGQDSAHSEVNVGASLATDEGRHILIEQPDASTGNGLTRSSRERRRTFYEQH